MESKHPPRVWIKLNNELGDMALDFRGIAPMFPPDHFGGLPDCTEPYMSVSEANALAEEREARARREAFEAEYEKWRKANPDFDPKDRYDDFFKDAFYLGYGRCSELMAQAPEKAPAGSTVCQHGGEPFTCKVCRAPEKEEPNERR